MLMQTTQPILHSSHITEDFVKHCETFNFYLFDEYRRRLRPESSRLSAQPSILHRGVCFMASLFLKALVFPE